MRNGDINHRPKVALTLSAYTRPTRVYIRVQCDCGLKPKQSFRFTSKVVSVFASLSPNVGNLVHGNTPQNSGRIGGGVGSLFSAETCSITERGKMWPKLLLMTNRKLHVRAFDWCQNQRPWMTLNGHCALCFKNIILSFPQKRFVTLKMS